MQRAVGHKSKDIRVRQNGNTAEVIAYADKRIRGCGADTMNYKAWQKEKCGSSRAAIERELACLYGA